MVRYLADVQIRFAIEVRYLEVDQVEFYTEVRCIAVSQVYNRAGDTTRLRSSVPGNRSDLSRFMQSTAVYRYALQSPMLQSRNFKVCLVIAQVTFHNEGRSTW